MMGTNLEQGCVVGTAVVFVSMCIQQTGIARWHKDGFVEQAFLQQVQTSGSAAASSSACMQQATVMQTGGSWHTTSCVSILGQHGSSLFLVDDSAALALTTV